MLRFLLNVKIQGKKVYEKMRNNICLFVFKLDLIIYFFFYKIFGIQGLFYGNMK